MSLKALDYESLNENVKNCQYAVRGELYLRASELQKEGKKVSFLVTPFCKILELSLALINLINICNRSFSQTLETLMR